MIYKDEDYPYFLSVRKFGNDWEISMEKFGKEKSELLTEQKIQGKEDPLYLKVISNSLAFECYYAFKEGEGNRFAKSLSAKKWNLTLIISL